MATKIATITLNPAYDLIGYCDQIELGEVNLVQTVELLPAGKGINVAKVLHNLNDKVTVSGFLGEDNKEGFSTLFNQLNLNDHFVTIKGKTRINVKITEQNGEVTDLNFSGFEIDKQNWQHFVSTSLNLLKEFELVVVSGSLPHGIDLEDFSKWLKEVKKVCPKLIFDSSRDALIAGLKENPWLIKPNDKELEILVGHKLESLEEVKKAALTLVNQGIENVVISLGSKGALWITKNEAWFAKPPKCKVVSTVGAGDSMVAGITHSLSKNLSIKESLTFASAIAALSVSQAGVGICDTNALEQMLTKIDTREL